MGEFGSDLIYLELVQLPWKLERNPLWLWFLTKGHRVRSKFQLSGVSKAWIKGLFLRFLAEFEVLVSVCFRQAEKFDQVIAFHFLHDAVFERCTALELDVKVPVLGDLLVDFLHQVGVLCAE